MARRKILFISFGCVLLLVGSGFLYFQFFHPPPPLEEKFVVEKLPAPAVSPEATPGIILAQPKDKALLPQTRVAYQTFNNCGPATLSMILSYYDIYKSQKELGNEMRPYQHPKGDNDDKTIFPEEFVSWVEKFGLKAIHRPNGSLQLIKLLDPDNIYPIFNLSTSYYHLGEYEKSVVEFEKVESRLPRRMLWYQIEPILAYKELKNYERVFQISNWLFENGNRAFSELYQIRGEIYLEKGDKEAARREFELALKYNQNFQLAKEALQNL